MTNIALVAGSCLGGWAWDRVTPRLRAAGHDVHPLTLTGFGDRAHLATPETNMSLHATDIAASLEVHDLHDVVLVGHSYASYAVTAAAERAPERIGRLVHVDAGRLQDGKSIFDTVPPFVREAMEAAVARNDGWRLPFLNDEELVTYYGPDHGLSAEDLKWIRSHTVGHPIECYREAVAIQDPRAAALPRTHVNCTLDPNPSPVSPDDPDTDYAELRSGHWPMFSIPEETAALLDRIARG
jgi:pimeloyl-ACP methyl ester carboxylesterase